jgi:hypothetical protein
MSGPSTDLNSQIKRQVVVKIRERRSINTTWACHEKRQSKHFSPSSPYSLSRGRRIEVKGKGIYVIIK